jgi:hypothetical protein
MFNVQKCSKSHEIYIYYNEYIKDDEDESVTTLEKIIKQGGVKEFAGIIDLVTVKRLSGEEITRIKKLHDILVDKDINKLNVISDNKKILENIKDIMPDVSIKLLKKE